MKLMEEMRLISQKDILETKIAGHFHNTYDRAIENILISLANGVRTFDSSVAGLGGCPYAEGATGNVATEDVLFMMEILGIETGVDIKKVIEIGNRITKILNVENRSSTTVDELERIDMYRKMLI
jgi:hydroxymethylglutaryl-CoA lyase